ncbi:hypothetical protein KKH27_07385 [bacterium]|nr:hypothetical protein [bacterium]
MKYMMNNRPQHCWLTLLFLLPMFVFAADGDWVARSFETRGPVSALDNPAELGKVNTRDWTIELPGGGATVSNNSFSVRFWNENIARDDYWDAAETQEILARIPSDGLKAHATVNAPLVGVRWHEFAFNARMFGGGRADLPKSAAELAFVGTKLNESYSISDLLGQSVVVSDYALSYGHMLPQHRIPELAAGATVHYFQGYAYANAWNETANLFTSADVIQGQGEFTSEAATNGNGFGLDLGLAATLSPRWRAGLAVHGIASKLNWNLDETTIYRFATDQAGLNLDSLDEENYTDRVFEDEDVTIKGGRASSRMPLVVRASALFLAAPKWTLAGVVAAQTNDTPLSESGLEAGAAAQWQSTSWSVLQGGIQLGGTHRTLFSFGGGVRLGTYELDLSIAAAGGLFNSAHGMGAAISQRIAF